MDSDLSKQLGPLATLAGLWFLDLVPDGLYGKKVYAAHSKNEMGLWRQRHDRL